MSRSRYRPKASYRVVALLVCFALVFNSIALPPVLYAQSAPATADQKPTVYLPLIQSATTTVDVSTGTATIPLRESDAMVADADRDVTGRTLPAPSDAKPAYPLNHLLDANPQAAGTPPQNHDFEAPTVPIGTPPTNHDFSAAAYDVGTPPTNAAFETGDFTGWTTAGTVNMQSNATQGYYGRLQSAGVLTSEAFTVDATAQEVVFEVGYLTTNNYSWFELYALSGAGYATETKIAEDNCSSCGYWVTYGANLAAYAGQSIKLKFKRRFGNVGIDAVRMRVLLPSYTFPGKITRAEEGNGNVYARISKDHSVTTAAFTVDNSAQSATVSMTGASAAGDQYKIDVLSGPTFATVTQVWLDTSALDAWNTVQLNLSPWQGQNVKLRITALYGSVGADNIALQAIIAPGWQLTGNPYVRTDTNGNHYLSTNGDVTSAPFTVAPGVQQMSLSWMVPYDVPAAEYLVWLRRGPAFNNEVVMGTLIGGPAGSMGILKFSPYLYTGEMLQLYLDRNWGRMNFDGAASGESVLPGWQAASYGAVEVGEDSYGSYATAYDGGGFIIRSSEINVGVLDRSNGADARYYAIAYDIGQVTGSLLEVYWQNAQGNDVKVFQDAANTPTGYRVSYFPIYDFMAQSGRFFVKATGGGKVYSIADNIARQQLNEPFSYKVGIQIDTSSGSFGYGATDLRTEGVTPLVFTRYYNGHADRRGRLGYRWSHSYETRLIVNNNNDVGIIFGSGKEVFFIRNGTTFRPADARIYDTLVQNGDGSYTYTTKAKQQYNFTAAGSLTTIKDPNNNTITLAYDGAGRLSSIVAQGGATFTLAYNGAGQLASVTDPLGATVSYAYNGSGDLASATRPDNGVEQYQYYSHQLTHVIDATGQTLLQNSFDAGHRVVQQTDAAGKTLTIAYDTPAAGVTSVTDPEGGVSRYYFDAYQRTTDWVAPTGQVTSYLYDAVGNLQKVIDGGAGEWNFGYDANGNLLNSQDPLGNPMLFTYNPQQLPTTVTDAKGNVTTFAYDAKGNVTQITDALNGITTFTYDAAGNLLTKTDPLQHTESYTYDAAGNRLSRTDALGHTWQWSYNAANRVTSETDPNGHTTQYFYDLVGRLIAIRNHLGGQKNFLYDQVGHLLMSEDELGRRTFWDYDARGLVERKIDAAGKETIYTYDDNRNLLTMTDPLGHTTTYVYDANNRLTSMSKPNGATWQYEYDGRGKLTKEINPANKAVSYVYDDAGRLTHTQFAAGLVATFSYDDNGNLTQRVDPGNQTINYSYDALNRLTVMSDSSGLPITSYSYDAAGRRLTASNAANETTTFTYDAANRLTAITDPLNHTTTLGYDAAGNRTNTTDPLHRSNSVVYDALNRPLVYADAAGNQTQVVYDAAGQVSQVVEATGAVTSFTYDARGLQTQITNPLQQITAFVYDDAGQVVQQIDAANQTTSYAYNSVGWLTAVTNPLGKTTSYTHDVMGNVTATTDPLGRAQTITYNDLNQPVTITDAAGIATSFTYNQAGRLLSRTGAVGSLSFQYNGRGLLTTVTDALQRTTTYEYDNVGRRTKIIDPRGNSAYFAYDAASRLTSMTDALGGSVHYSYDAANQLTAVTNPNGKTTTYSYGVLGNLLSKTDPLNRTHSFGYDQLGRRTSATDARGITVNYAYDLLGRLTTLTHPNGANSYSYDASGRLITASDGAGSTSFSYDAASRVTAIAAPQGTVTYSYNDADQRTSMTLPGARTITYGYDNSGRLNTITDWLGRATTLAYNAQGVVNQISQPNGVAAGYTYGADGALTGLTYSPAGLFSANYSYDGNNNRTAATTPAGTEAYTLDALNRLTAVNYPNGDTAAYSYDANGNRLAQTRNGATTTYSYDDAGQLLTDGATTYSYDANGNLLSAGADSYTWDWANRLTSATVNGQTVNYSYDALDVRVGANVNGAQSNYLWDRAAELPLLVDDGAHAYIHGAGPLAQIDPSGVRQGLLSDGLGSIRGVTDGSGALVGTADYDAFGGYRNQTGVTSRFGFTGEYLAQETGFWHLRARDLNPALGRFLSADSVQPNAPGTQGYNLYAYVANNPTTWVDPSGFSVASNNLTPAQTAILVGLMVAAPAMLVLPMAIGLPLVLFALILRCALTEGCMAQFGDMQGLIKNLGSSGLNTVTWTAQTLSEAIAQYPLLPDASPPMRFLANIGLGLIGLDTITDFATLVSGRDPLTGEIMTPYDNAWTFLALIIPGATGGAVREGADFLAGYGDEVAHAVGAACSFDEDTPVATDKGDVPIRDVAVGDRVLAWHEETDSTGYYTVTAVWGHEDPVTVQLVINGETIDTTPEHPFYEIESAPWLPANATEGRWTPAGELKAGDQIRQSDGTTGVVQTIVFEATPQMMYNLTVAEAHTFFVGNGEWLVHNQCRRNTIDILFTQAKYSLSGNLDDGTRYRVVENVKRLKADPSFDLPPIEIFAKWPFMDEWGPMTHPIKGYTGDPVNLLNGHIYTLNNRRLITYIRADRETIPVVWAKLKTIYENRYEFDTRNWGVWITRRYNKR